MDAVTINVNKTLGQKPRGIVGTPCRLAQAICYLASAFSSCIKNKNPCRSESSGANTEPIGLHWSKAEKHIHRSANYWWYGLHWGVLYVRRNEGSIQIMSSCEFLVVACKRTQMIRYVEGLSAQTYLLRVNKCWIQKKIWRDTEEALEFQSEHMAHNSTNWDTICVVVTGGVFIAALERLNVFIKIGWAFYRSSLVSDQLPQDGVTIVRRVGLSEAPRLQ